MICVTFFDSKSVNDKGSRKSVNHFRDHTCFFMHLHLPGREDAA